MNLHRQGKRALRLVQRQARKARAWLRYLTEYRRFAAESQKSRPDFQLHWKNAWPILTERTPTTALTAHYVNFPAWAARKVREIAPEKHVDISSYLQFSAILSAFVPTEFYDYRPAPLRLSSLYVGHCDLTALHFESHSIASLSCMHVIEHVGLGRYGDPLDALGDVKAARELARVLAPGGSLLFAAPMGRSRVEFNAHRIYAYRQIRDLFPSLHVREFSFLPDNESETGFIPDPTAEFCDTQRHGCGCFWFIKPLAPC